MAKTELYFIASKNYFNGVIRILGQKSQDKKVIYVTANKTYGHIIDLLKATKIKVGRFFFIDCISKSISNGERDKIKNCLFIETPESLTAIGIAIHKSIQYVSGERILFLDSISTLMVYHNANSIIKFSNFLVNLMQINNIDLIILAIRSDADKDVIKEIESFVDVVNGV